MINDDFKYHDQTGSFYQKGIDNSSGTADSSGVSNSSNPSPTKGLFKKIKDKIDTFKENKENQKKSTLPANPGEYHMEELVSVEEDMFKLYAESHAHSTLCIYDIVEWKTGMKDMTLPEYGQKAVVLYRKKQNSTEWTGTEDKVIHRIRLSDISIGVFVTEEQMKKYNVDTSFILLEADSRRFRKIGHLEGYPLTPVWSKKEEDEDDGN